MWVRVVWGRSAGRLLAVDDEKGREGIKAGFYVRTARHERAVRDVRETARV